MARAIERAKARLIPGSRKSEDLDARTKMLRQMTGHLKSVAAARHRATGGPTRDGTGHSGR
jgi:hypothetical protein